MTTFEQINQIMLQNGWERIIKKSEYEKLKRENKEVTARIGWSYFKLKQDDKDLEAKMWKEKYENATRNFAEIINMFGDLREKLNSLAENSDKKEVDKMLNIILSDRDGDKT
jgi:mevalonate kinase